MPINNCNKTKKSIPIHNARNQVVGNVKDNTFYRTFHNEHILQKPPALAFDQCALSEMEKAGATLLQCKNVDTGQVFTVRLPLFKEKSFVIERGGYCKQQALLLKYWETTSKNQSPTTTAKTPQSNTSSGNDRRKADLAWQQYMLKF